ncbi:hypothetical protein [Kitasatospora sp. Root107]|uniref:hypothetical protein n=1 Tax=Kitasatospora sp. Root107 TaxID=1736424 RepID=UPI001F226C32|nr:hypothetical protein [Kitasatospora sp. Root107]
MSAFENADIKALLALAHRRRGGRDAAVPVLVPRRETVARFFAAQVLTTPGRFRLVPTRANGQPAFGLYRLGPDGRHHAHSVTVLTLAGDRVARISGFLDPSLFGPFGLAPTHPPTNGGA